jgi:hypothetical protein
VLSQILPLSIARYSTFAHHHVANAVIIVVDTIYLSNGLFNVLLFSITRPFLLPHDLPSSDIELPITGPPRSESLNDGADMGTPAPAMGHASPINYHGPEHDSVNGGTLQWSPDGMAYVVNTDSPSTVSVGL